MYLYVCIDNYKCMLSLHGLAWGLRLLLSFYIRFLQLYIQTHKKHLCILTIMNVSCFCMALHGGSGSFSAFTSLSCNHIYKHTCIVTIINICSIYMASCPRWSESASQPSAFTSWSHTHKKHLYVPARPRFYNYMTSFIHIDNYKCVRSLASCPCCW